MFSKINNKELDGLNFCRDVYDLWDEVLASDDGVTLLRMRKGACKQLVEELLPLAKFIQCKYSVGRKIKVKWIDGSQNFDAEIYQSGQYVDQGIFKAHAFLEITSAVHPNDYLLRELINEKGYAFGPKNIRREKGGIITTPDPYSGTEHVDDFINIVCTAIGKKLAKDYPDNTSLIVACALNTIYLNHDWDMLTNEVRQRIGQHHFDEIFLCDLSSTDRFTSL